MTTRKNSKKNIKQDNKLRMLIDASQTEESRMAIVKNGLIEDLEVESLVRRQIKGNIYLAKVTRVEPSLQAAFVNYGGNRHGFLPFSEIHPDYYRIPVADRERLVAEQQEMERKAQEEAARIAEEEDRKAAEEEEGGASASKAQKDENNIEEIEDEEQILEAGAEAESADSDNDDTDDEDEESDAENAEADDMPSDSDKAARKKKGKESDESASGEEDDADATDESQDETAESDNDANANENDQDRRRGRGRGRFRNRRGGRGSKRYAASRSREDKVSDDADDEISSFEPFWKSIRRAYKIQEVIKRGQIMLIQVGKEERGNKGAAVTTYITLPGRYCVLMPNTPQSGGVSRKIANFKDRKRMREILKDLTIPAGMSVILRTAGTTRTKAEIKRDLDYLMRLWNTARDLTLKSTAPALINEEGSLIKRAIRDIYNKDIDEVIVSGEDGYKTARDMMKMLMPSHVKKVLQHKDHTPLFIAENLEKQIEAMHNPQVELKSGGYLVINPTEALVSIDVNSGRATKERNIDDTALRTNIEAAEEIARQLRLRDLGGLVVIDFIDMENRKYNARVEKAMRDALAGDRARIQIGRISSFGLMEMSRQRLHPSITESYFEPCKACMGMGVVKTVDTMALTILRAVEQAGLEQPGSDVTVTMANDVALYLLNNHRKSISDLEARYNLQLIVSVEKVEDDRGFDLAIEVRDMVNEEQDQQGDNDHGEQDNDETTEKRSSRSRKKRDADRSRRGEKSSDQEAGAGTENGPESEISPESADQSEETGSDSSKSTETTEDKPKKKSTRGRRKKIPIEEKSDDSPSEDSEGLAKADKRQSNAGVDDAAPAASESQDNDDTKVIAATNDNADAVTEAQAAEAAEAENIAAREAEKVNEAPKSKKKGWWNKITG